MARITVIGAGLAGMSAAYELRQCWARTTPSRWSGNGPLFSFTPSNPWLAVGWRRRTRPRSPRGYTSRAAASRSTSNRSPHRCRGQPRGAGRWQGAGARLPADLHRPEAGFRRDAGLGPGRWFHAFGVHLAACRACLARYQKFTAEPGPVVVGAVQGASCFGPAYEFAFILDADLRKRKMRDKVPMTYITSEPYVGHMGLGGVGDSKGLMESEFRQRHIQWITNAKVLEVRADAVVVEEHDEAGKPQGHARDCPRKFSMLLPAFAGVDAVAARGGAVQSARLRDHRQAPAQPAIPRTSSPPASAWRSRHRSPRPCQPGVPKTGFMIESMVTTIVQQHRGRAGWQARRLRRHLECRVPGRHGRYRRRLRGAAADSAAQRHLGEERQVGAPGQGRLREVLPPQDAHGTSEPIYEKYVLSALGIERLKETIRQRRSSTMNLDRAVMAFAGVMVLASLALAH